jgi:hypothetical protein
MHVPGMAFEDRRGPGTAAGSGGGPSTARGLRRLATRVSAGRNRGRDKTAGTGGGGVPAVDTPGGPVGDSGPAPVRADPVLRWKNPSHAPDGDFTACAVPNAQLRVHGIPDHGDSWDSVSSFSLSYDGYAYWDDLSELATRSIRGWTRDRTLPHSIDEVRACLFYEQRRWHHFGEDPNGRGAQYVWALLDTLRSLVAARAATEAAPVDQPTPGAPPPSAPVPSRAPGPIRSFLDDDDGYLAWASEHTGGFVVNADRTLSPNSLMLHRATCSSIGGPAASGRTRTANYRKVCGSDLEALVDWCRTDIGADPGCCRRCRPLSGE